MNGRGPLDTVKEAVGLKEYPIPPWEPEVEAKIKAFTQITKENPRTKQQMLYYRYDYNKDGKIDNNDADGDIDFFTFKINIYNEQITVINSKLKFFEDIITKYESEINLIENYFQQREIEYQGLAERFLDSEEIYKGLEQQHKAGLETGTFREGDAEELALKQAMQDAYSKIPKLPEKDEYVYSGFYYDIDDPTKTKKFYPDLRLLIQDYERRISLTEGNAIYKNLQERLAANTYWLKKSEDDYNAVFNPPQK